MLLYETQTRSRVHFQKQFFAGLRCLEFTRQSNLNFQPSAVDFVHHRVHTPQSSTAALMMMCADHHHHHHHHRAWANVCVMAAAIKLDLQVIGRRCGRLRPDCFTVFSSKRREVDTSCVFMFPLLSPLCVCVQILLPSWPKNVPPLHTHTQVCCYGIASEAVCKEGKKKGEKKKRSALQQLGARAMKQQGLSCLYCLSVVYGPVFAFNYYTKLNSNRHLEATGSHVHVRPPARPPARSPSTRALYILHTQTHLADPFLPRLKCALKS